MADLGLCRTPVQRLISYPIHRHRCLLNVGGGEGAREIRGRTLIGRRRGPGGAPCPTISDLFLLADLVGKPDFYIAGMMPFSWETLRQRICRSDGVPRRPVVAWFLNSSRQKRCRKNIRSYRQKKRYGVTAYDNRKRVFAWLYVDVLESPAWHGLSINARRVIERLLIENTRHRYRANGQLRVSYLQFAEHGVSTRFVPTAIRELKVSGLLAVAKGKRTRKYAAENLYRIKFLGTLDGPATWRHSAQKTESTPRMYGRSSKASLSKTKPWEAEGISRWTWYYLQAKSKAPIVKHKFAQKKNSSYPQKVRSVCTNCTFCATVL
jgi:hypothetical protein